MATNANRNWLLAERQTPWQPSADVYRTRDGWLVKFDLAGVKTEDVTVSMRGRRVDDQRLPARLVLRGGIKSLLDGDLVQPL